MSNIIETARQLGFFKVLVNAVDASGLDDTLEHKGPFTIFAPTDQAFAKLAPGTLEVLLKDPTKLKILLAKHIIAGKVTSEDVVIRRNVMNATGETLTTDMQADGVHIAGARVIEADMDADNGMIHAIDTVLMPWAA